MVIRQYNLCQPVPAPELVPGLTPPAMLPFGVADTLTSTLDLRTLARTFRLYGRAVMRELLQGKI